jgi:hypothetical protein
MKKLLKVFALISILITITAVIAGCAGPAGATGAQGPAGPNSIVAMGVVDSGGTLSATCRYNVTSVTWNYTASRWEIQLTGIDFLTWDYVVTVCPFVGYATQDSMDNKLIIYIWDYLGNPVLSGFSFVVFAQPS